MIFVTIISFGALVSFAVLVFTMNRSTIRALERSHERTTKHTEGLVDRLMAVDYVEWQSLRHANTAEAFELEEPEVPPEPTLSTGPDRGGFGSRYGLAAVPEIDTEADEEALRDELP